MRRLGANTAVAATAACAVALSGLAISGYSPASTKIVATPLAEPTPSTTPPAPSTTRDPSPISSPSDSGTLAPSESPSPEATSPSPSATPAPPLSPLPKSETATVVVLGDAHGDESDEWVHQLGAILGESRRTLVHQVNQSGSIGYGATVTNGSGDPQLVIWNASRARPITITSSNIDDVMPERPNLVLLSLGRSEDAAGVKKQAQQSLSAIKERWPDVQVAVVLQPKRPDGQNLDSLQVVRDFAQQESLPVIDVPKALSSDGKSPSANQEAGPAIPGSSQEVWAETVAQALSGS